MTVENKADLLQPLITVALPVFNGGDFLEHAVRSILNQTWKNWELLIIDDGSTDGAIDRLPFLPDARISVIRDGQNRGLAARLNQAILLANGKYFARMDHDDICYPERFFLQLEYLEQHQEVDLLSTKCIEMREDGAIKGPWPFAKTHAVICRRPWLGFYMPHPSWMGRIEWFRKNLYKEPAPYCCEDQELLLRAHAKSHYDALDCVLLAYRVRDHNPISKLFRTCVAMLKMQMIYFIGKRQFAFALLSGLAFFGRIFKYGSKNFYALIAK
jgi:glycosyltransferase involved in cell wall biosynthesis